KMEKQQVAALSEFLGNLLSDLPRGDNVPSGPELDLEQPIIAEWPVGTLQLTYDTDLDRVLIVAEEAMFAEEDEPEPALPRIARFGATRDQMAAVAIRGTQLVEAGRPPCPLCGHPIDPTGHACPRTNGNRPPAR